MPPVQPRFVLRRLGMAPLAAVILLPTGRIEPTPVPAQAGARQQAAVSLEVESSSGQASRVELGKDPILDLAALDAAFLRPTQLSALESSPLSMGLEDAVVHLHSGDLLHARVRPLAEEQLQLGLLGDVRVSLSVDALASIHYPMRQGVLAAWQAGPPATGDLLHWIRSQGLDRVEGTLQSFSSEGVHFDSRLLGARVFPWSEVGALFVEPLSTKPNPQPQAGLNARQAVQVDLRDGSRLGARFVRLSREGLALESTDLGPLSFPLGAVAEVALDDGRSSFVGQLPLVFDAAKEGTPFGDAKGLAFPPRVDRCVLGTPLMSGGRSVARGLGVHAPSRVSIALEGQWKGLCGQVAIDDSVHFLPHKGSARFRVLADERLLWESPIVHYGAGPISLGAIDLAGAKQLVLEVDDGGDGHVADRANWLRLRLTR